MKQLRRLGLLLMVLLVLCGIAAAQDTVANTPQELYEAIYENLAEQNTEFAIVYKGATDVYYNEDGQERTCIELVRAAAGYFPDESMTDLHMMNLKAAGVVNDGYALQFTMEYLLNKEQMAWVAQEVRDIAASLQVEGKSDLVKIKTVYEYVASNFLYDDTLTKYTDYEGLKTGEMVCQGFALLTYRLLWEVDVPCRMVTGVSMGQMHGWNLVKLEGKWYCLDATWDGKTESSPMVWNYFLKAPKNFSGHNTDEYFENEEYYLSHPPAGEDYPLKTMEIVVNGGVFGSLIIRNGQSLTLNANWSEPSGANITWSSSNEEAVKILPTGMLFSLTPGDAIITLRSSDERFLPVFFPVYAIDMDSCSPWAKEKLVSYYLRNLYPKELCSDYQSAITREEFAHLLYQFLVGYYDESGTAVLPGFKDIADSPYWLSIIYCTARGLFEGTGETAFSPTAPVTREQAAKILSGLLDAMGQENFGGAALNFTDGDTVSHWAAEGVSRILDTGLLQLDENHCFRPTDPLSREEAAVIMENIFLEYVEQ